MSKVTLSVALPLYESKDSAWIALESLCYQRNGGGPSWELLVAEEITNNMVGAENILSYKDRLRLVGCERISYTPLTEWIPLPKKWKLLANKTSSTSEVFCLQASDCYSQPWRIFESYKLIKKGNDWVQKGKGIFYDLFTGIVVLFIRGKKTYRPALDMCFRTQYARQLESSSLKSNIDGWLFRQCAKSKKGKLRIGWTLSNSWMYGIDTNGLNRISKSRLTQMRKKRPPFYRCTLDWRKNLPNKVVERLLSYKEKK